MNYLYNKLLFLILLFPLSFQPMRADSLYAWLFSSLNKDGTISLFRHTTTVTGHASQTNYYIDAKGVATLVFLTLIVVKVADKVADKGSDLLMPLLMHYCPVSQWKEDYQREKEEKDLDKELEIIALQEKRNKVKKLKEMQGLVSMVPLGSLGKEAAK